jgi:hypothetical protein
MKYSIQIVLLLFFISCNNKKSTKFNKVKEKEAINNVINTWHKNAATTNYKGYFEVMDTDFVFLGTEAGEHWNKKEFEKFSKPFFDRGKAWNFTPLKRNIYFQKEGNIAWFDELLNTWMGVCRGSGVLIKKENSWKIKHYVLSLTIPNSNIDDVIKVNKEKDSILIKKLTHSFNGSF